MIITTSWEPECKHIENLKNCSVPSLLSDCIILIPAGPKKPKANGKKMDRTSITKLQHQTTAVWSNKLFQSWHLHGFVGCYFSITSNSLNGKPPTSVSVLQLQESSLSISCCSVAVVLWSSGTLVYRENILLCLFLLPVYLFRIVRWCWRVWAQER